MNHENVAAKSFGDLLRQHRRAVQLTQEELAERAGISERAVSDLERGARTRPRRDTVALLADALGLEDGDRAAFERSVARQRAEPRSLGSTVLNTIPADVTPLLGRERDEAEVAELVCGRSRLVTLVGPGGVGKTRLAMRVAQTVAHEFQDGVNVVWLAPLRDYREVLPVVAESLDIKESPGEPVHASVLRALRDKNLLLALDNFEHLLEAATLASDLLATCPRLVILTTSRQPLHLRGEFVHEVRPLALADAGSADSLDTLSAFAAPAVFIQRARASGPLLPLQDSDAPAVAEICRRLDGLPLALELGAARMRYLSAADLLGQLMAGLGSLIEGPRDLPVRQQTMTNAIAWSYSLLDRDEQTLLRSLSVFSGGFDGESVEFVVDLLHTRVPSVLRSMRDKSLIIAEQSAGGHSRFRMLETIREYAASQLEISQESDRLRDRHASYFVKQAETIGPALSGPGHELANETIEAESANVRIALHWLLDGKRKEPGLRLAGSIWRFWYSNGRFSEGRTWLEDFLALEGPVPPEVLAPALRGAGVLASSMSDFEASAIHYSRSLSLFQGLGDDDGASAVLNGMGVDDFLLGRYQDAVSHLEASVAAARKAGVPFGIAMALGNMANAVRHLGDLRRAGQLYEEAVRLYREIDPKLPALSNAVGNLGSLEFRMGRYDRAEKLISEALALALNGGRSPQAASAMHDLGCLARATGDYASAERWWREALSLHETAGDRGSAALTRANLADVLRARGDLVGARALATLSLRDATAIESVRGVGYAHQFLGDIARDEGRTDEARRQYAEALDVTVAAGDVHATANCLEHVAWLTAVTQPAAALAILACADVVRQSVWTPLEPVDRTEHDRAVTKAEARVGEAERRAAKDLAGEIDPHDARALADLFTASVRSVNPK